MKCARCGFPAMPVYGEKRGWQAACTRCGATEGMGAVEGLPIDVAQNASRAWNCYRAQVFDVAQEFLSAITQMSDCRPEYLWFELLAEYGVKYCETNAGQYTVNFWRRELPEGVLSKQAGYQRLRRKAAGDLGELRSYERAAEDIDRGLRQISETQKDAYDVFLCFKDRDAEEGTSRRENGEKDPEKEETPFLVGSSENLVARRSNVAVCEKAMQLPEPLLRLEKRELSEPYTCQRAARALDGGNGI